MIENWFTNRCMTLVGASGRALTGESRDVAEAALTAARAVGKKVWTDRGGSFYTKERKLFARAEPLVDQNGNPVRICGHRVKLKAKFCSKCGGAAPGGWWRCGGCGKMIGNESMTCPHCGRRQNPSLRFNLADGNWRKGEEIFAERFELTDVAVVMSKGVNVQESQRVILLESGAVTDVLGAGFYQAANLNPESQVGDRSIVMVDNAEFSIPVCVEGVRTKDDIEADLHVVLTLRFDPRGAKEFMCNLMGESLYLRDDALTASLGYDEVAHCLLQDVDGSARNFCNTQDVSALFKDADCRIRLEDCIAERLTRNLSSIGMQFVRLKEVEFESEVFARLREMAGQVEEKRREIEFMKRADELANDATRREAMNESAMEDYMAQLAHEKGIKDDLRVQEVERIRDQWDFDREYLELEHENNLDDLQQKRQLARDERDAEHDERVRDLRHRKELERRIAEQNSSLEFMKVEALIQEAKLAIERKKVVAEQESTAGWARIKQQNQAFKQGQKIELMKAAQGVDLKALLMAEEDPEKREHLLRLHEQEQQSRMTPELLLAAAAARGNAAAAEALTRMNRSQIDAIERSKAENREIYERMLQMNEREFNQATDSMAKNASGTGNTTTQIIK